MTEEEKSNLSLFGPEARQRAAAAARCSVMEVMPAYSPSTERDMRRLTGMLNLWSGHACEQKTATKMYSLANKEALRLKDISCGFSACVSHVGCNSRVICACPCHVSCVLASQHEAAHA